MRFFSNRDRAVHLGRFPLERIPRRDAPPSLDGVRDSFPAPGASPLGRIVNEYIALFEQLRVEPAAPEVAPYPDDPARLAAELKANCHFLDASLAACGEVPASAWLGAPMRGQTHALSIVVEFGRLPEAGNLARGWIEGTEYDCALLRAAEIGAISAAFLRRLGFEATLHTRDCTDVSHAKVLVAGGLGRWNGVRVEAPFIGTRFASCIVTTSAPLIAVLHSFVMDTSTP
jgi:hypothetical protein